MNMQTKLYTMQLFYHCLTINCAAHPQAAIVELLDFPELIDFANLMNFAELAELTEKDQSHRKVQTQGNKKFLPPSQPSIVY